MSRIWVVWTSLLIGTCGAAGADELAIVAGVESQPLKAQVRRLVSSLELLGEPLPAERRATLEAALAEMDDARAVRDLQQALDPLCLLGVSINPESRVKVARGPAAASLHEQGWRVFLVKVQNEAGVTAPLRVTSPNAAPLYARSTSASRPAGQVKPEDVPQRWLDVATYDEQPMVRPLSGLELEYRIVQLYSRDRGRREATLACDVGQGTQDLGFRNEVSILFECQPAVRVVLEVLDDDGHPTTGQFVIRDAQGRIYPSQTRRL
ncbi:MAG: hypothetical protein AB7O38_19180, partial [Pirellulaceae bacterium]